MKDTSQHPNPIVTQATVIILLLLLSVPHQTLANSSKEPVGAVILPTLDSPSHLEEATIILEAIRQELQNKQFLGIDWNYSRELIAKKERSWLKKCAYDPICLGELATKLKASILLSGNLEESSTEGFTLRLVVLRADNPSFLGTQSIALPPRFSPREYAINVVRDLILPHANAAEPELLALVPLSDGAKPTGATPPQEPGLVVPPLTSALSTQEPSGLFTTGLSTTIIGGTIIATAGFFRIKSAIGANSIEPQTAQVQTHEAIEAAKRDFDLSLQLMIVGTSVTLVGAGLMAIDLLVESDESPKAQLQLTSNGLRFYAQF